MAKNDNLKDFLTDVADAIRAKKGTSAAINPQDFSAEIASIETGGGGAAVAVVEKDVNFRDYDGTLLHSYTKSQFLSLTALPELPTRQGLTCQGWNYTLEDAQSYVSKYGHLEVGATYITDDGKTRLYITIAEEGRMEFSIRLVTVENGVSVDWGDGSPAETIGISTGTFTFFKHTYSSKGDYIVTIDVLEGTMSFYGTSQYNTFGNKVYGNMIKKLEIGNGVTSIGENAFNNCFSLSSVVIPYGVTTIDNYSFQGCNSLSSVVIPNSVTSINSYAFSNCNSLSSVVIPNSVTTIATYAFRNCFSLSSVVIPNSVTSINSYAFGNCAGIAIYDFSHTLTVPALSNANAFSSLASDCKFVVPDALYDEWIAATNWSKYASQIVKASEFNG